MAFATAIAITVSSATASYRQPESIGHNLALYTRRGGRNRNDTAENRKNTLLHNPGEITFVYGRFDRLFLPPV